MRRIENCGAPIERLAAVKPAGAETPLPLLAPMPLVECAGGVTWRAAVLSSSSRRRIGGGGGLRNSMFPPFGAAVDEVNGGIQKQHDQQQHESRRVGFLGLVEVAGGGSLVDEVGQRRSGTAQVVEGEGAAFDRGEVLSRAEQDDDDRGVADDAAEAEHRPGRQLRAAGRQQDPASSRSLRLADRVGGLADVALGSPSAPRESLATISGRATRESIAEAAKNDRPKTTPSVVRLKKPSKVLEKITVPNSAQHDRGDAGDRLDRRFGDPRECPGPTVLDQPDRDSNPDRRRD